MPPDPHVKENVTHADCALDLMAKGTLNNMASIENIIITRLPQLFTTELYPMD